MLDKVIEVRNKTTILDPDEILSEKDEIKLKKFFQDDYQYFLKQV